MCKTNRLSEVISISVFVSKTAKLRTKERRIFPSRTQFSMEAEEFFKASMEGQVCRNLMTDVEKKLHFMTTQRYPRVWRGEKREACHSLLQWVEISQSIVQGFSDLVSLFLWSGMSLSSPVPRNTGILFAHWFPTLNRVERKCWSVRRWKSPIKGYIEDVEATPYSLISLMARLQ